MGVYRSVHTRPREQIMMKCHRISIKTYCGFFRKETIPLFRKSCLNTVSNLYYFFLIKHISSITKQTKNSPVFLQVVLEFKTQKKHNSLLLGKTFKHLDFYYHCFSCIGLFVHHTYIFYLLCYWHEFYIFRYSILSNQEKLIWVLIVKKQYAYSGITRNYKCFV